MPPYPLFTFIGFLIHSVAMLLISIRLFSRHSTKAIFFLAAGVFAYAVDFSLITILFYLFPNTIAKTHIFIFIASVLVPVGTLFLLMSVMSVSPRWRSYSWVVFFIGFIAVFLLYILGLGRLQNAPEITYSYIHPAYPASITQSQAVGGLIGGFSVGFFFLYHAFRTTLFVRRRAVILGIGSIMLGVSSLFWLSSEPIIYRVTHTIGPIGSILVALGFFAFQIPHSDNKDVNT